MSMGRRETSNERRRRLLVYRSAQPAASGAASDQRQLERVRQARRPTAQYSGSVRRRLRSRWFSLVPVRRRSMVMVAVAVSTLTLVLGAAHWAAVLWPALAARPELARPLRLDRPDSFGSWARGALFASSAAVSLLIYQLRRYRTDDYLGSYRIWPPLIVLMGLASVDSVCRLVPWLGAILEWTTGDAQLMAGSDWVRIALTVGGMALALRIIAEVWRSSTAMPLMLIAVVALALPTAARWGVVSSGTRFRWLLLTSMPLIGSAALWLSCVAYLRMLFREVRQLDQDTIAARVRRWREQSDQLKQQRRQQRQAARDQLAAEKDAARAQQRAAKEAAIAQRQAQKEAAAQQRQADAQQRAADKQSKANERAAAKDHQAAEKNAAREAQRAAQASPAKATQDAAHPARTADTATSSSGSGSSAAASESSGSEPASGKKTSSWRFWKRKPRDPQATPTDATPSAPQQRQPTTAGPTDHPTQSDQATKSAQSERSDKSDRPGKADRPARQPRSWRFWKRKPTAEAGSGDDGKDGDAKGSQQPAGSAHGQPAGVAAEQSGEGGANNAPQRPSRLRGWVSRWKLKRKAAPAGDDAAARDRSPAGDRPDDGSGGDDDIDWASMDKQERRRMRREMKRGGNAA